MGVVGWNRCSRHVPGLEPGDEFLDILGINTEGLALCVSSTTMLPTTTSTTTHVYRMDMAVAEMVMALRFVSALRNEHISAVQGLWVNPQGI